MSERPFLQVVRGDATPEEIAALVAVLSAHAVARGGRSGDGGRERPSAWADRSRAVRRPLPHGPGTWRASSLPR
ncbi:acyl-CoA carboxylase subunit epsilon [Thermomonospora umbrina]|uniref:Acyl-CoA carboxylase epsilon subunit-like protein n=1 Tax=Thermomonospora umbrina TaxID=111806 RepID=A0A3D9SWC6_9ACTN|nr:acyl-CoA carboxylase subunit epsilon [Thermomonospora umbrina]REE98323.1 acyl-CoA carboxylase epsilon subunit-like protein [Thermomonospora umbrina]